MVGKSTILTAAHCFFDGNKKVSSVTFIPGKNGSSNPYGSYASTKLHIPTKYKEAYAANQEDEKWKYDYALVELSGTPGAKLGYFALGGYNTQYSIEKLVGEKAIVIGYPTTKMHRHKSDIIGYNSEKYQIYYTTDTSSGQSGAPVFIYTGTGAKYYIVAIHNGGIEGQKIYKAVNKVLRLYIFFVLISFILSGIITWKR